MGKSDKKAGQNSFLLWGGIAILLFVTIAFTLKAIVHPERLQRYTYPVIIHAIFMILWFTLFPLQAYLIRRGLFQRHRLIGKISFVIAIGIIVTGLNVAFDISKEFDRPEQFIGNSYQLLMFLIFYASSIFLILKNKSDWHKRFMLIASLNFIAPAFSRTLEILNQGPESALFYQTLCIILLPISYDIVTRKRIHKATIIGITVCLITLAIAFALLPKLIPVVRSWH